MVELEGLTTNYFYIIKLLISLLFYDKIFVVKQFKINNLLMKGRALNK